MMIIEYLKDQIPLTEISQISANPLSGQYYDPVKRHNRRLDPSTRERNSGTTLERPKYGYGRVRAILRNEDIPRVLDFLEEYHK